MASDPIGWALHDGKAGMSSQALGLAEASGLAFAEKRLDIRFPWNCLPPLLWPAPLDAVGSRTRLTPPWPDFVIACGRNAAMPALAIRRASGGHTLAALIQDPGVGRAEFDLAIVPEHDRLRGPRVLVTRGAVHRITPARLSAERGRFPSLAALPRPILAVLIGGSNKAYRLSLRRVGEIAEAVAALLRERGGSALVTPSRRTGAKGLALLRQGLAGLSAAIWDGVAENPYFAYLALADAFLVTADSVSMISEAVATGKPVHILGLDGGNVKFARFHQLMQNAGITRPFAGRIEEWSYPVPDDTARAGAALRALVLSRFRPAGVRMKGATIYAGLLVAALALFLLLPQTDLLVSGLFYAPGHGFLLAHWPPVELIFHAIPWIAWGVVLVVAGGAAWLCLSGRPLWRLDRNALLFIALSMALGPGLLANTVLKDHWGRARPVQIEEFGGSHRFTPAPLPARQCATNCSFVSGHAALGFSLVAFAFLLPPGPSRRRAIGGTLAFGGLVGLVRVAQGGHFLSDVVWAGLLMFGTTGLLYWWIVERDGLAAPPLRRLYRRIGHGTASAWRFARQSWPSPSVRIGAAVAATTILVAVSIETVDRPLALYLHSRGPDLHALFDLTGQLGEGWGWLVLFALAFAGLHWGGAAPRLRQIAPRMRALSAIPAFLFVSIAVSGLAVDLMKIGFGRLRPKLLFRADLYGFSWFAWRPDHWSFPSGHTATFVALVTALWWLWPRHLLFYVLIAAIVAGSRVVAGQHYPSDVIGGALIAVLTTWYVAVAFERGGIDLSAACRGWIDPGAMPPWPCRRAGAILAGRLGRRRDRAGGSLAPRATGVVSARHHGAADRDV